MIQKDLKEYIGALINNSEVDQKILDEVQNIELLLSVYCLGLQGKKFPIGYLYKEFNLEKDIPTQFHTLVGQMAILKAKTFGISRTREYLDKSVVLLLQEFSNYFSSRASLLTSSENV